jgi:hypothetical protein
VKTVAEYAEKFRADYPHRYAIAFGALEGAQLQGHDLGEQLRRLTAAMDEVENGTGEER